MRIADHGRQMACGLPPSWDRSSDGCSELGELASLADTGHHDIRRCGRWIRLCGRRMTRRARRPRSSPVQSAQSRVRNSTFCQPAAAYRRTVAGGLSLWGSGVTAEPLFPPAWASRHRSALGSGLSASSSATAPASTPRRSAQAACRGIQPFPSGSRTARKLALNHAGARCSSCNLVYLPPRWRRRKGRRCRPGNRRRASPTGMVFS